MATVKIKTDVDDASFQAFLGVFSQYAKAFAEHPREWEKIAQSGGRARETFEDAAKSVQALADGMSGVLGHAQRLEDVSSKTATHWHRLAGGTRDAAKNITGATTSLLKWAGATAIVGGLGLAAGGAALYGIDVLGHSVSRNRSTSLGLGTTYGGLASARTNYARFGDADSALGRINEAQTDPSSRGRQGFGALGIQNYEGKDSTELLAEVLEKSKKWLDSVPPGLLASRLESSGVGSLLSLSEAQRIKNSPGGEAGEQADRIRSNRAGLEVGAREQAQWQTFSTQLTRAGKQIETVLVDRLVALAPGLTDLSAAVTHLGQEALKRDGPVAQWLSEFNTGIEWLAENVDSPEFRDGVGTFVRDVGEIATSVFAFGKKLASLLHWLAGLVGDNIAAQTPLATGTVGDYYGGAHDAGAGAGYHFGRRGLGGGGLGAHDGGTRAHFGYHGGSAATKGAWWTDDRVQHAYDRLVAGGLSPREAEGQIARSAYVEAPNGPASANNIGGGHLGIYQASRDRQRNFGGSTNFDAQLDAIIKEKGTTEGASHRAGLAARNDQEAARAASMFERAEGYAARHDGTDNFTDKTAAAIPKIHAIVTRRPPTKVVVSSNTGGNPTKAMAAAAAPP